MRVCNCNDIKTIEFQVAAAAMETQIKEAPDLLEAVGIVYRHARDTKSDIAPRIPSCTRCFDDVANLIKAADHFKDQSIPEHAPQRIWDGTCPRQAQCLTPPAPALMAAE